MMEYVQHLLMRLFWVLVIMLVVENGCNGCWEKERIALLQLKESINFPNRTSLPSWEEDDYLDCCQWERVTCNFTTHRVIKLSLNTSRDWRRDDYWYLNASILLPFESLQSLDLSDNQLHGFVGNEGIGILSNLTNLEELDFYGNYLENSILSLNKLSNLKILNLGNNILNRSISINGIGILSNLSNLEELDLSWNYELDNSILPSLNKLSNLKILNLARTGLNGSISINEFDGLNNLKELDLSFNEIASMIVTGIGITSNFSNLEELHLEGNEFDNSILPSLNKLSNLKILNLARNRLNGSISINEFDGLNNLKELDLNSNRLRSIITVNGSQEESGLLSELEVLDLSYNDLNDSIWSFLTELSSIKTLNLSVNLGLHGAIHRLCELKTLRELDITQTGFGGSLPWCLVNLTSLRLLDITSNHFNGNIARSPLINLTSLEYLAISNNDFEIPISFKSFFNHSKLKLVESLNNKLLEDQEDIFATPPRFQLIGLFLSHSEHGRITGSFPQFLYHQHEFILVELSGIVFNGKFPYWLLENNTRMETLLLSSNSIDGPLLLPSRQMRNLKKLDISNNHLEGFLPYNIANSFPSLEFLNMSTNNFEGNISSSFRDMTSLQFLDLSNNRLSGEISGLIGNTSALQLLFLSGNHLEGPITIEFCELKGLSVLDLSENSLTGVIPSCFDSSRIMSIRLSKNRLHGPFPTAFQNLSWIMELDLSYNQFNGNMPTWIDSLYGLTMLFLQHNDFEGNIPKELCHLSMLTLIDLSFNNFFGSIPPCIGKIDSSGLNGQSFWDWDIYKRPKLPLSLENRYVDTTYTPAVQEVEFETKGMTLSYKGNVLYLFSGINLAHNRLTGPIPPEIGNLSHIEVLNFSHNHLTGTIPATFSKLKSIESLDLSYNHLSGKIPSQLTELYSLEVFDLSNNNLSGRTPQRVFQFATFESSSYDGNPLLCGEPLLKKCNADYSPPPMPRAVINGSEEDSGFIDMDTFYMSFAGSYLAVVLAIVAILFINPYWRRAWFHLIEVFLTSSYYFVVDNLVYPVRGFLWK